MLRRPARTALCALGTVVAVGATVTVNGLTHSAQGAVSSSFNLLRATTVEFRAPGSVIDEQGVDRLRRLRGVNGAGLLWDIDDGQPVNVAAAPDATAASAPGRATQLSFTAASASALQAIGAHVASGRLYDASVERDRQMVAVLGSTAARELGITSPIGAPAIFVGQSALTVVGIVDTSQQETQALLGVLVPPYVGSVIGGPSTERRVIVRTAPGAAQLIGNEGPYTLAPYQPARVAANVPPDPASLREHVEASLSGLLLVLALLGLVVGFLSISSITMLSVTQRRSEIGLRRAVGYYRGDIARLIMAEATFTGVLGGIVGASVGVLATSAAAASRGWTPVMDPTMTLLAPLLGIAVGALAGVYPAIAAARITPLAALRSG